MKQLVQFCLSVVVGSTLVFAAAQSARAQDEAISSVRRLPTNVYAYLSVRNTTELKEKFNASLSGQMLNHPDLATVRESIIEVIQGKSEEFDEKLGASLEEFLSIPQGEITVAVVQPPGKPIAPVAMIDFGDKGDIVNTVLAKITEGMQEKGIERSTEEYEGNEIISLKEDVAEGQAQPTDFDLAYCIKDSYLIIGKGSDVVQTVLARWDGEHDSTLMSNDVFRYLVKKCSGEGETSPSLITWYLDPIGLVQVLAASNPQMGMVVGFLPLTGLSNLKAIGGTVSMGEGDFDTVSRTLFYMEQPTTGLLKVFNFPSDSQVPPAWVPKNATSYFAINWGIDKAYRSIEMLVDTFRGPGALAMVLDQLSESQFNGDVHLKDDVIDLLTGKIRVVRDMPDVDDPEHTRSLFAMEVKNGEDAKAVLAKIANMEGFPVETREYRGETLYEITIPAGMAAQLNPGQAVGGGEEQLIGVAIVKDHLMIGMDVTILEQVILGDADAGKLSDSAAYQSIAKYFPAETSAVTYTESDADVKTAYEFVKSGNSGFMLGEAFEEIDFSQLPDFETIAKFLPPRGSYMVPDEQGYFLQSFTPKKSEAP